MNYDALLSESDSAGLIVKEKPLRYNDGRIKGTRIAIRQDIQTSAEKACVLAEELGHHYTSSGNILDQSDVSNRKQEYHARMWAYDKMIGLSGLIECYKAGCQNRYESAEHLGVTEQFWDDAVSAYRRKYGECVHMNDYVILFEPNLAVMERV